MPDAQVAHEPAPVPTSRSGDGVACPSSPPQPCHSCHYSSNCTKAGTSRALNTCWHHTRGPELSPPTTLPTQHSAVLTGAQLTNGEREKLRDSPQGHTARDWRVRSRSDIKARPRLRHAETGVKLREAPCHLPGPLPKSRAQAVVGTSTGRGPPGSSRWQRAGEPCRPCQPPITPPKRANCLHHGKSSVATEPFEKLRWRSPGQRRLPRPAAEPGVQWSMKGEFGAIGVDHRRAHKRGTPGCDHTPATARLSSAWHSTAALSLK